MTSRKTISSSERRSIGSSDRRSAGNRNTLSVGNRRFVLPDYLYADDVDGNKVSPAFWIDATRDQDTPSTGSADTSPQNLANDNILDLSGGVSGEGPPIWQDGYWELQDGNQTWVNRNISKSLREFSAYFVGKRYNSGGVFHLLDTRNSSTSSQHILRYDDDNNQFEYVFHPSDINVGQTQVSTTIDVTQTFFVGVTLNYNPFTGDLQRSVHASTVSSRSTSGSGSGTILQDELVIGLNPFNNGGQWLGEIYEAGIFDSRVSESYMENTIKSEMQTKWGAQ